MNKFNSYYLIFYNKSKHNYVKNQYNKLTKDISRLKDMEVKLFKDKDNINKDEKDNIEENNNNIININNNNTYNNVNDAKLFLKSIKDFLFSSIKEINNFENDSLKIYYISMQNYFSIKGLLISKNINY